MKQKDKEPGDIWWEVPESKTHMVEDIPEKILIDWRESSWSPVMINKQKIATKQKKTDINQRKRMWNHISWSNRKNQCDHPLW